jgi:decaprenylphospho-beta-D-ribofuranose 2-oxidase
LSGAGRADTRGLALADVDLASFDRQFSARSRMQRPDRYRLIEALPRDATRIARGSGVSYVAASFGADAISQSLAAFDRILAFDDEDGRLVVEAGARIGDVQRFALARGWYLAVAPGHPAATVGGCIAADVHGKNPARDGTFRAVVERIEIVTARGDVIVASASENAEFFAATFAGFGLTGVITRATLRLARPPAALIVRRVPVANLVDAARVLREAANAPVLYGWHDGRAKQFGRGVIRIGLASDSVDARATRIPAASCDLPAEIRPMPIAMWNRAGIAAANTWFGSRWRRAGQSPLSLAEALFPLNDARGYFAGFGSAGLVEAQWLVPHALFDEFAGTLAERVARDRPRIALIASKLFAGKPEGFAFDGEGVALAIQLPSPADPRQRAFLETLAEVAIKHGGRANLIKESTLDAATARRAIGAFDGARERLAAHNPGGLHASELARRLAL